MRAKCAFQPTNFEFHGGRGIGGVAELALDSIARAMDKDQEGGMSEENG